MKSALTSQFWNQELESSKSPDAVVRCLAHDPPPLTSLLCSGLSRPQQLLLLQRLLPVPGTPSYAVDDDGGGGWVLDRVVASAGAQDWWGTLTGRLRVQRLISHGRPKSQRGTETLRLQQHGDPAETGAALRNHRGAETGAAFVNGDSLPQQAPLCQQGIALNGRGFKALGQALLDPSLYALAWNSRVRLGPHTWLNASSELQTLPWHPRERGAPRETAASREMGGPRERGTPEDRRMWWKAFVRKAPLRGRVNMRHKMEKHQLVADASLNSRCVDGHGCWWTAPLALSLDLASLGTWHGFRYRVGLHHVASEAQLDTSPNVNAAAADAHLPQGALPGTRMQVGSSLKGEVVLWKDRCENNRRRQAEAAEKKRAQTGQGMPRAMRFSFGDKCYNLMASRPRITLCGLLGGIGCIALKTKPISTSAGPEISRDSLSCSMPRVSAHLFALLGATAQLGLFERPVLDHTLISAQLHYTTEASHLSLAHPQPPSGLSRSGHLLSGLRCAPSVALTLSQQVFGPIRARYDGRFGLHLQGGRIETETLETVYSIDCSLEKLLGAARFVVWYSPTRKEGMAEVRLLER